MTEKQSLKNKGFTLVEALVYLSIVSILLIVIILFIFWIVQSNTKTRVIRETLDNAERTMRIISDEIKEAKGIYTPTTGAGQLSLETTKYLASGEESSYIDFYLCGSRICFKKESRDAIALTSDNIEVSQLSFSQFNTGGNPGVRITLTVDYKNPNNKPEYRSSITLTTSVSLR